MLIWPQVRPHMEKAAASTFGRFEADDVLDTVMVGGRQLWVAFDDDSDIKGAVVTGFNLYPRKKYLELTFVGGTDGLKWKKPMLKILQHWAYDTGCDGIESSGRLGATGRTGWTRLLRDDGFKPLGQYFELPTAAGGLEE
jgi:hypothetical protein